MILPTALIKCSRIKPITYNMFNIFCSNIDIIWQRFHCQLVSQRQTAIPCA